MLQNTEALLAQEEEQQPTLASKIFNRKTVKMIIGAAVVAGCVAAVVRSYTLDATVDQMDANGKVITLVAATEHGYRTLTLVFDLLLSGCKTVFKDLKNHGTAGPSLQQRTSAPGGGGTKITAEERRGRASWQHEAR